MQIHYLSWLVSNSSLILYTVYQVELGCVHLKQRNMQSDFPDFPCEALEGLWRCNTSPELLSYPPILGKCGVSKFAILRCVEHGVVPQKLH